MIEIPPEKLALLTFRQRQVIRYTSLGLTLEEISRLLGLSRGTVDSHICRAKRVLGITRSTQLVRIAIKYNISPLEDDFTPEELSRLRRCGWSMYDRTSASSPDRLNRL